MNTLALIGFYLCAVPDVSQEDSWLIQLDKDLLTPISSSGLVMSQLLQVLQGLK